MATNTISKNSYRTVPPEYSQSDSVVNNIISHIFFLLEEKRFFSVDEAKLKQKQLM